MPRGSCGACSTRADRRSPPRALRASTAAARDAKVCWGSREGGARDRHGQEERRRAARGRRWSPGVCRGSTGWRGTRSTASPTRSAAGTTCGGSTCGTRRRRRSPPGADAHLTGRLAVCAGSCGPGNLHLINGLYDCHRSRVPVARHRRADPEPRDRERLFPGDPARASLRPVQPLLRAGVPARADAARARDRHADGGVAARCLGRRAARRRGPARRRRAGAAAALSRAEALRYAPPRTRSRRWCGCSTPSTRIDHPRRRGLRGRARRARSPSRVALQAPIVHALRGKEFIEYDNPFDVGMTGPAGVLVRLPRDDGLRPPADGGDGLSLPPVLPRQGDDRADRHPRRAARPPREGRSRVRGRRADHAPRPPPPCSTSGATAPISRPRASTTGRRGRASTSSPPPAPAAERSPPPVRRAGARRARRGRRHLHLRRRHSDGVGGALPDDERPAPAARLVQPRVDGQCAAAGHRGADQPIRGARSCRCRATAGSPCCWAICSRSASSQLPVKIVVFRNDALAFVELEMKAAGLLDFATDLHNPDFARMAEAAGLLGLRAETLGSGPPDARAGARPSTGPPSSRCSCTATSWSCRPTISLRAGGRLRPLHAEGRAERPQRRGHRPRPGQPVPLSRRRRGPG